MPDLHRLCGLYSFYNKATMREYIGKTRCLGERQNEHRSELRRFRHPSRKMTTDYVLHGMDSFSFYPIETFAIEEYDDPTVFLYLYQAERLLIQEYQPVYNTYVKHSKESAILLPSAAYAGT